MLDRHRLVGMHAALCVLPYFGDVGAGVPPAAGDLWISTLDAPIACDPASIVFCGGTPPYRLETIKGANYDGVIGQIATGLEQEGAWDWTCVPLIPTISWLH